MSEVKVGEYVRNADGYIEKMDSCDRLTNIYKDEDGKLRKWEGEDAFGNEYSSLIVKHSFNIIDLIEIGDILRIKVQFHHELEPFYMLKEINDKNSVEWEDILEQIDLCHYEIIEILTKEQYKSNCYKLEE